MSASLRQTVRRVRPVVWIYNGVLHLLGLCRYTRDLVRFLLMQRGRADRFPFGVRAPRLGDNTAGTDFDRHYIYHPAWAARVLSRTMPAEHVDISSSLFFCSMVSAFVPVRFYDYRPADLRLDNLVAGEVDILDLPFTDGSIRSLSCMHVVEHIGLGRYGDPLDPEGDMKAIAELRRVLAPGGDLLFVVPVGRPRLLFNVHRIYSCEQVMACFAGFSLVEFALIPDRAEEGGLIRNAEFTMADLQEYGCGCFWLRKP